MLLALTVLSAITTFAQSSSSIDIARQSITKVPSPLSLEVFPAFDIPLGDGSSWFSYGGAVDLGARCRIPLSIFSLLGGIEYSYAPIQAAASLSLALARVGGGIQIPLASGIAVLAYPPGSYYFIKAGGKTM